MPHHTTVAMKAHENTSAKSFTASAAWRQRPPNVLKSSGISVTVRCARPLRDAEVEEDTREDEKGDGVLLPFEGSSEDITPRDLEQCEQRRADEQHRPSGRQDAVLEGPPDGVGLQHLPNDDLGSVLRAVDLFDPGRSWRVLARELLAFLLEIVDELLRGRRHLALDPARRPVAERAGELRPPAPTSSTRPAWTDPWCRTFRR